MEVEVWHVDTDELVGRLELAKPIPQEVGARVDVKMKGTVEHKTLGSFNAIQMLVARMIGSKKKCTHCDGGLVLVRGIEMHCPECKGKGYHFTDHYFALETNLPYPLLKRIEGFTPHIRIPSLMEMFNVNRTRLH